MLRTAPWCFARISSTRWSADFRLRVPDSAWLTSSSVASRRVSRVSLPLVALGFIDRPVQPQQAAYRRVGFRTPSYIIVGGPGCNIDHRRQTIRPRDALARGEAPR